MLSRRTFDILEYVCRIIRKTHEVFGGLQVVATGDFKQLPPVPNLHLDDDGEHCFTSLAFQSIFVHKYNLNTVHRQSDEDLVTAVRELCDGNPTTKTADFLRSLDRPVPGEPVVLYGTNTDVDFHNQNCLDEAAGQQIVFKSEDSGDKSQLKQMSAQKQLALKEGAPVILLRNLTHLLVNGSKGTVHQLLPGKDPVVSFDGKLVSVPRVKFEFFNHAKSSVTACRIQYPLKLAYALTVHRAQGQTLPFLIVDCFSFFAPGQLGVAIGRAKGVSGLRVRNFNLQAATIKHAPIVYDYYRKLPSSVLPLHDLQCCRHLCVNCTTEVDEAGDRGGIDQVEMEDGVDRAFSLLDNANASTFVADYVDIVDNDNDKDDDDDEDDEWDDDDDDDDAVSGVFRTDENRFVHACSNIRETIIEVDLKPFLDTHKTTLQEKSLTAFASVIETRLKTQMPSPGLPKEKWVSYYSYLNEYLHSEEYFDVLYTLFQRRQLTQTENKFGTKLVLYINDSLVKNTADSISTEQKASQTSTLKPSTPLSSVGDAAKAKVRYVAGAVMKKLSTSFRRQSVNALTNIALSSKRKEAYRKYQMLAKMRVTEQHIAEVSEMKSSLNEIENRQGPSRGLFHIGDTLFMFFLHLHLAIASFLSAESFAAYSKSIYIKCRDYIQNSDPVFVLWEALFQDDDAASSSDLVRKLYCSIVELYLRVLFVDQLHILKEKIPRKKKQALRAKIESSTGKRKSKRVYMCPDCELEILENPVSYDEFSIGCDKCQMWYHMTCQNISEPVTSDKWHCESCKKSNMDKRNGKYKRRK